MQAKTIETQEPTKDFIRWQIRLKKIVTVLRKDTKTPNYLPFSQNLSYFIFQTFPGLENWFAIFKTFSRIQGRLRLENLDVYLEIRIMDLQSNAKNGFYFREIRPHRGFQLWNPNSDSLHWFLSLPLVWEIRKNGFAKLSREQWSFSAIIMSAPARPLFLRTFFQMLFRITKKKERKKIQEQISQRWNPLSDFAVNWKSETRISKSKSRFPNRMHTVVEETPQHTSCILLASRFIISSVFSSTCCDKSSRSRSRDFTVAFISAVCTLCSAFLFSISSTNTRYNYIRHTMYIEYIALWNACELIRCTTCG